MRGLWFGLALLCPAAFAAPWVFDPPILVSHDPAQRAFFHLESAGRKSIALSDGWVAITWEDNRDGVSRCYVALKAPGKNTFGVEIRISGEQEAFEPAIAGLGQGRFAVAWEEAGHIQARTVATDGLGKSIALDSEEAAQVSLDYAQTGGLFAVWSAKGKTFWRVQAARLTPTASGALKAGRATVIKAGKIEGDQSYPSVVVIDAKKLLVAWEDRSAGHTLILSSVSQDGGAHFAAPQAVNDAVWRGQIGGFGRGTGVMRVVLSNAGPKGVAAVWADKRDFLAGYDVYAAFAPGPRYKFGANEKAQDDFGNEIAQWHPAIAANRQGTVAAVWDDDRDGTPDIWLAWRSASGWSDNLAVPGASGPGVQSDPATVLDEANNLHLAWVEKADLNSPSRIRYVMGRWADAKK
jgi:hypothetical protein